MSLISEYILKKLSAVDLENELLYLLKKYNNITNNFSFLFLTDTNKQIPESAITNDDYFIIQDLLKSCKHKKLDVFLETLGGSGEAVLEIVNFLRSKFEEVRFIISGQAKSAGTMLALSGDEILMTETGSLGPIDAQIKIGRFVNSAEDYMLWIKEKQKIANVNKKLNPFDATMVAQISPGELKGVSDSLDFAIEMVEEWLPKYKFKNWKFTETENTPVTEKMKKDQAHKIAKALTDKSKWKTHGRPIKIKDLMDIGLKIKRVEDDDLINDTVSRIQVVSKLYFGSSSTYKIFASENFKIFKNATPRKVTSEIPKVTEPDAVEIVVKCDKCGEKNKIYIKLIDDPGIDKNFKNKGFKKFPIDNRFKCSCGAIIDLTGIRNDIEKKFNKKIII